MLVIEVQQKNTNVVNFSNRSSNLSVSVLLFSFLFFLLFFFVHSICIRRLYVLCLWAISDSCIWLKFGRTSLVRIAYLDFALDKKKKQFGSRYMVLVSKKRVGCSHSKSNKRERTAKIEEILFYKRKVTHYTVNNVRHWPTVQFFETIKKWFSIFFGISLSTVNKLKVIFTKKKIFFLSKRKCDNLPRTVPVCNFRLS